MKISLELLAIASVLFAASSASAATVRYTATLNGQQQTPSVTDTAATGTADFDYDDVTRELRGIITLELPPDTEVTNQHIHHGKCGETGAIVKNLTSPGMNGVIAIDPVKPIQLDANQAAALEAGELYINIHTKKHPSGEIRGQILREGSTTTCPAGGGETSSGEGGGEGEPTGTTTSAASTDEGGCSTSGGPLTGGLTFAALGVLVTRLVRRRRA